VAFDRTAGVNPVPFIVTLTNMSASGSGHPPGWPSDCGFPLAAGPRRLTLSDDLCAARTSKPGNGFTSD
jgi:hypothetical protein